jgi:Tol biopolymer transport system component
MWRFTRLHIVFVVLSASLLLYQQTIAALDTTLNVGKIAFQVLKDNRRSIYIVSPDGSGLQRIFTAPTDKHRIDFLKWSPDHRFLTFLATSYDPQLTRNAVYLIATDGNTKQEFTEVFPAALKWSPDGKYLAYFRALNNQNSPDRGFYLANADGTNPRLISKRTIASYAWSPDSKQIALTTSGDIYTLNIDGDQLLERITTNDTEPTQLYWSADGKFISYKLNRELFTVQLDTKSRYSLTSGFPDRGFEMYLYGWSHYSWSPDSQQIALYRPQTVIPLKQDYGYAIYLVSKNGDNRSKLTESCMGHAAFWSPTSNQLLCTLGHGVGVIVSVDVASKKATRVVEENLGHDTAFGAKWSPDGNRISFVFRNEICIINTDGQNRTCLTTTSDLGEIIELIWQADEHAIGVQS